MVDQGVGGPRQQDAAIGGVGDGVLVDVDVGGGEVDADPGLAGDAGDGVALDLDIAPVGVALARQPDPEAYDIGDRVVLDQVPGHVGGGRGGDIDALGPLAADRIALDRDAGGDGVGRDADAGVAAGQGVVGDGEVADVGLGAGRAVLVGDDIIGADARDVVAGNRDAVPAVDLDPVFPQGALGRRMSDEGVVLDEVVVASGVQDQRLGGIVAVDADALDSGVGGEGPGPVGAQDDPIGMGPVGEVVDGEVLDRGVGHPDHTDRGEVPCALD